jgi:hypothetical protein
MVAAALLAGLIAAAPAVDGPKAYQSGEAAAKAGHFREAAAAFAQAQAAGYRPLYSSYNLACAQAHLGERDAAFQALERVAQAGVPALADRLATDEDLASLRGDRRWQSLLDEAGAAAHPCQHDPKARELDFWLGAWDVLGPDGQKVGDSHIDLMLDQCVLLENWTGRGGSSGKSFNLWDAGRKEWLQTWVDDHGSQHNYHGRFVDGAMRFDGETYDAKGQRQPLRLTFTPLPGGKVRQLMESSSDGGKTWSTAFDGTYVHRAPAQ